ncbi:hypothetical protein [Moorena sp. SIO3H5]|nr:hypothetical protein [Moorena sp. SIO3H5]
MYKALEDVSKHNLSIKLHNPDAELGSILDGIKSNDIRQVSV